MADIPTPGQKTQGAKQLDPNLGLNTIQTTMDKFLSAASVEAIYGAPVSQGETIVIPVAEVLSIAGFGLQAQKQAGMTESALGVDSENLSGATKIYEDCGFRVMKTETIYKKPLITSGQK